MKKIPQGLVYNPSHAGGAGSTSGACSAEVSASAALALCTVKQERKLWIQERRNETAVHEPRTDKSKASVLYGLGSAKAPILVVFSAGYSPTAREKTRKTVCSGAPPSH